MYEWVGWSGCRQAGWPVEIRREDAAIARRELEALLRRCRAGQHGRAIVGTELRTGECLTVVENVEGDVVRIRPDAELRIVVELRGTVTERIQVVGPGRIARGRNSHALQVRCGRHRELREHPAIRDFVALSARLAIVIRGKAASPRGEQRVAGARTLQEGAGRHADPPEGS